MFFFCLVCHRDVSVKAHGSGDFKQYFWSDGHRFREVCYRVHIGLPVYTRLMEPMELSHNQEAEYCSRPFVDLGEEFLFPEDLVSKHSWV